MKKLITLCLALAGLVGTASAAKLYIRLNPSHDWWTNVHVYEWEDGNADDNNSGWGTEAGAISPTYMYGKIWYVFEMTNKRNRAQVTRHWGGTYDNKTVPITVTDDTYVEILNEKSGDEWKVNVESAPQWNYIIMRNNIISGQNGAWNNSDMNTIIDPANPDKFTYELTKKQIDENSYLLEDGIRFRFHHGNTVTYDDYGTYKGTDQYPEIAPQTGGGVSVSFANDVTSYYQDVNSSNYWVFDVPTFNYEKLVFTADYSTKKWVIRVDAYISKTVSATYKYATFGTSVPVDLSGLAAEGVTAYTVRANGTTITTEAKTDALYAGEGVLLQNTSGIDVTVSIPVAASATSNSDNDLVAFTGTGKLTQPTEGSETYYILADDVYGVGFYKVNYTTGNAMGTNTAYLVVSDNVNARSFLWFDESTGISETVSKATADNHYYNLNGQSVAQPTKGLYIVNGKKVIKK